MTRFPQFSQLKAEFRRHHLTALRALSWSSPLLLPLLGGLIFVLVFYWAYSGIEDELYQVRDDGVITMSHAKNLVEYGFIGVNPSGGRVEGYSAPVQFFLFAAVYALTGIGYAAYATLQTYAATFLLGALFVLFFRERKLLAIVLAALAALFLAYLRPFIEWHGSGMENAVTHVLFLAAALVMVSSVKTGRINYLLAFPVFLASISRLESIYHIGPLLVLFAVFWLWAFRDWSGAYFSLVVLGLWGLFQLSSVAATFSHITAASCCCWRCRPLLCFHVAGRRSCFCSCSAA